MAVNDIPALQPPPQSSLASRMLAHRLFRPLAALAVLLLIDFLLIPGFFHLEVRDGHLYGALVDVVNRAAPLMLAAIGMTLVIATRGIDISVGAVVALSGTIAAMLVGGTMVINNGVPEYVAQTPMALAMLAAISAALADRYAAPVEMIEADVIEFLDDMAARRLVEIA